MRPDMVNKLLRMLLLFMFSRLASTWSLSIYDNTECTPENYYVYYNDPLSGVSECTRVGSDSDNAMCSFFRDGGAAGYEDCADQLDLASMTTIGWSFPDDTTCYMGYDSNCTWTDTYLFETQFCADFPFPRPEGEEGNQLYFMCGLDFGGEGLPSVG